MIIIWNSVMSIQVTVRTTADIKMSLERKSSTEYSIHSPTVILCCADHDALI